MKDFLMTGIKFLFFTPVALISVAVLYFFYCEANKAYWDYRVKEMCLKDGGVTVYERIVLSSEEYKKYIDSAGNIIIPSESSSLSNKYPYVWKNEDTYIKKSNPKVRRSEYITYSKNNKKILAKWVTYSRGGGDFPNGISAPSNFDCEDVFGVKPSIEKKIFTVKEN